MRVPKFFRTVATEPQHRLAESKYSIMLVSLPDGYQIVIVSEPQELALLLVAGTELDSWIGIGILQKNHHRHPFLQ